ncbi:MAG: cyanophycinase [Pseudomonadota bacterium]
MMAFIRAFFVAVSFLMASTAVFAEGLIVAHGGGSAFFYGDPPRLFGAFSYAFKKAGGKRAKIVTVSSYANDENRELQDLLKDAGYRNVTHLNVAAPNAPEILLGADIIYFDSGVQTQLMRKLKTKPKVIAAIKQAHANGTVIGGSSAGAAALSDVMICCDKGGKAIESRGLALLKNVVIDQHYSQREREFRLRQIISKHPNKIGIGIDETVAVAFHKGKITVIKSPENKKRANKKVDAGCRRINGIYTCTCDTFCDCAGRGLKKPFVENGIKRQCVQSLSFGNSARQMATIVTNKNGQLSESHIKPGKSLKLAY